MGKRKSQLKKSNKQKSKKSTKRSSPKSPKTSPKSPKTSPKTSLQNWTTIVNYLLQTGIVEKVKYVANAYIQINLLDNIDEMRNLIDGIVVSKFFYRNYEHDTYVIWIDRNYDDNYLILGLNHPFIFNENGIIQCDESGLFKDYDAGKICCELERYGRSTKFDQVKRYKKINDYLNYTRGELEYRKKRQFFIIKKYRDIQKDVELIDLNIRLLKSIGNINLFNKLKEEREKLIDDIFLEAEEEANALDINRFD